MDVGLWVILWEYPKDSDTCHYFLKHLNDYVYPRSHASENRG